ncbi:tyrosyl-DNA phosphodiesterase [Grosmannia clavigera kw1407]|uniref:Tyrosyl-DNA phosphodiesterase n=1 Tax=Grosmannia clavigera (strain kw1407 / UAMH 11150) TaxID=655863 RepID=F0XGV8_GROCL|nr:tyrosyl-DNA phosphodiesterase [Grosmannia clavigera kw1407]EFX02897.1 tyrosyl-DNA phosphodiesterase [Grosmannia clavigera kw1407]
MGGQQAVIPSKRALDEADAGVGKDPRGIVIKSLSVPVSPPWKRRRNGEEAHDSTSTDAGVRFRSPFQLTAIRDLPAEDNVDTVTVDEIFGSPLVAECWEFNYLHDIGFFMDALNEDVRHLVHVHVVHGFWKREDQRRLELEAEAARYANVQLHTAFMPEPFGTHHSKMAVLFRHDDTAQVVIYTANMIPHDWANMTQGVWRSPLLPLLADDVDGEDESEIDGPVGSGRRFKTDLLSYLRAYNQRRSICRPLVERLARYDFAAVQAALIASVPGRHSLIRQPDEKYHTQWGWTALKNTLRSVPVQAVAPSTEIVLQVSSMATLGPTDAWIRHTLFSAMATASSAVDKGGSIGKEELQQPRFRAVFPTADEIRRSLEGYKSGTSIHTKIQSSQQQRQLQYMRPLLCHWANDSPDGAKLPDGATPIVNGRKRAAPHIKTYVRYGQVGVDWALLTSANLSKQAWGEAVTAAGEVRVASWEIGVMVWPGLFAETAVMQIVGGSDSVLQPATGKAAGRPVVALRVPYDLPLQQYGKGEIPWVCTLPDEEPDWTGQAWSG